MKRKGSLFYTVLARMFLVGTLGFVCLGTYHISQNGLTFPRSKTSLTHELAIPDQVSAPDGKLEPTKVPGRAVVFGYIDEQQLSNKQVVLRRHNITRVLYACFRNGDQICYKVVE